MFNPETGEWKHRKHQVTLFVCFVLSVDYFGFVLCLTQAQVDVLSQGVEHERQSPPNTSMLKTNFEKVKFVCALSNKISSCVKLPL